MEIFFTARFLKSFAKLEANVQDDVEHAIEEFEDRESHVRLKLHKLHGKMKEYHAFSANYHYRIIVKIEKNGAYCMDVGTHDLYE